jgi:hypothetical protein
MRRSLATQAITVFCLAEDFIVRGKQQESSLQVTKSQFDSYVRHFRTEATKNQHCEMLWKTCSARVSWERETRKGRKGRKTAVTEFSIVGPQLAVDAAMSMLEAEIQHQEAERQKEAAAKVREKAEAAAVELATAALVPAKSEPLDCSTKLHPSRPHRQGQRQRGPQPQPPPGPQPQLEPEPQPEPQSEQPIEPARGPPPVQQTPTQPPPMSPFLPVVSFNATWQQLHRPCAERFRAILRSDGLSFEDASASLLPLPVHVIARIVRRMFPTLRHTKVVVQAYISVCPAPPLISNAAVYESVKYVDTFSAFRLFVPHNPV